jgi:hypothetical protein
MMANKLNPRFIVLFVWLLTVSVSCFYVFDLYPIGNQLRPFLSWDAKSPVSTACLLAAFKGDHQAESSSGLQSVDPLFYCGYHLKNTLTQVGLYLFMTLSVLFLASRHQIFKLALFAFQLGLLLISVTAFFVTPVPGSLFNFWEISKFIARVGSLVSLTFLVPLLLLMKKGIRSGRTLGAPEFSFLIFCFALLLPLATHLIVSHSLASSGERHKEDLKRKVSFRLAKATYLPFSPLSQKSRISEEGDFITEYSFSDVSGELEGSGCAIVQSAHLDSPDPCSGLGENVKVKNEDGKLCIGVFPNGLTNSFLIFQREGTRIQIGCSGWAPFIKNPDSLLRMAESLDPDLD